MLRQPRHARLVALPLPSVAPATTPEAWAALDAELGRHLRARASHRASRASTESSALDGMVMALRRVRVTLETMTSLVSDDPDPAAATLVSRAYRWSIRVARELEVIEDLELDALREWTRFESFAPFARAFYDSALAGPFGTAPRSADVLRLRRDIDGVMAPIRIAVMSSAVAA
ncbi:MAG: hypothetical protein JWP97_1604 [Labilithrix sp.]|nr:hypothetical protein [Labilithrix sp.]